MEDRFLIDGVEYICNVTHTDNIVHYSVADAKRLAKLLIENGQEVVAVHDGRCPQSVDVDRNVYRFNGKKFTLNQCFDIWDWFKTSKVYEFTYFYDRVVFHAPFDYFYGAYKNDINNYVRI